MLPKRSPRGDDVRKRPAPRGKMRHSQPMNTSPRIETAFTPEINRLYHGWRVVGAAFVIALFGWGLGFYGVGIYLLQLQARHGWPTGEIAPAITLYYGLGAALIVFAGR